METSFGVDWKLVLHIVYGLFQFRVGWQRWQNIIPSAAEVMAAEGATRITQIHIHTYIYVLEGRSKMPNANVANIPMAIDENL